MSSVDNRIVRMQFDNDQFEAGVAKSMKSLDELTSKLQFKEAGKGISALQVALDGVDFEGITRSVYRLEHAFTSVTGMIGQRIKTDIVDQIEGAVKNLWNKTIGQAKSGGWARAMNIANAKFTIEGLKYSWDEVRKAADYAVTDTAYGFDEAANAASQLAASGVDFEKIIGKDGAGKDVTQMHKSLRAISGVAAMTNSSYSEISHIFTRIAGQGRVMANDLNSIASRGINAAATLAEAFGTTEAEIRELVGKGEISFQMFSDAMDNAFGDHAKEANKTFSGSLSNMKAALSRIGAIFAQPVIDKTNTFFISLTGQIKKFQKALSDVTENVVRKDVLDDAISQATKDADKLGYIGKQKADYITETVNAAVEAAKKAGKTEEKVTKMFQGHFAEAWEAGVEAASKLIDVLDTSWFKSVADFLDKIAIKATSVCKTISSAIDEFARPIKEAEEAAKKATGAIKDNLELDLQDLDLLHRILKNEFGYTQKRWKALDDIYAKGDSGKTGKWLQGYMDQLARVNYNFEELGWTEEEFKKKQEEATKSEAERIKAMSAYELLFNTIVQALGNYNDGMKHAKEITGNVFKTITSLGTSALKVLVAIGDGLGIGGVSFYNFAALLEPLSVSLRSFVEQLEPTHNGIAAIIDVFTELGFELNDVISHVVNAATAFFDCATAILSADESLDEIARSDNLSSMEKTAVSVLKILRNMWTIITNIGKSAVRVLISIKNAFKRVFDPSGVLMGFSSFTDGLAGISNKLLITEDAALGIENAFTLIFTAVQSVLTVFSKVIGKITSFIGGGGKVAKTVDKVTKSTEKLSDSVDGAIDAVGTMSPVLEKVLEFFQKIPKFFEDVWTGLKNSEKIQRLKDAFTSLWESIKKGKEEAMGPLSEALSHWATNTEGESVSAADIVVNAIENIADKIAWFVEQLPIWGKNVSDFFDKVKTFTEQTIEDLNLKDLTDSFKTAFDYALASGGNLSESVGNFIGGVFDALQKRMEETDWSKVAKTGAFALFMANLYSFFGTTKKLGGLLEAVAGIPEAIGSVIGKFGALFVTVQENIAKVVAAYTFKSFAVSILALVAAIVLLGTLPQEQLENGLMALTWITVCVAILIKIFASLIPGLAKMKKEAVKAKQIQQGGTIQIINNVSSIFGAATAIIAFGASISMLIAAIAYLVTQVDKAKPESIATVMDILIPLFIGMAALAIAMAVFAVAGKTKSNAGVVIASMAAVFIGVGAAVLMIARAIAILAGVKEGLVQGVVVALVVMGALMGFSYVLIKFGKRFKFTTGAGILLALVGMGVVVMAIAAFCWIIAGLGAIMGPEVYAAMGMMVLLIAGIGAATALMAREFSKIDNPWPFVALIGAIGAVMILIAGAFAIILNSLKDITGLDWLKVLAAFVIMMAPFAAVIILIKALAKNASSFGGDVAKPLLALAVVIAALGVSMLLIGVAAKLMMGVGLGPIVIIIAALVAMTAGLALVIKLVSGIDKAEKKLFAIAAAMIAMGAAILLIAAAMSLITTFSKDDLTGVIILFGAFIAAIIVVAAAIAALAYFDPTGNTLKGFTVLILALGAAFALVGVGVLAAAAGFYVLTQIGGKVANTIQSISAALAEHPVILVLMIVLIVAVAAALVVIVWKITEVATAVGKAFDKIWDVISKVGEKIGKFFNEKILGEHGMLNKIKDKFLALSPTLKTIMISTLTTVLAVIVMMTPKALEVLGYIIKKVIGFIVDLIPTLIDGLFSIVLRLLNGLADKIREESAVIAYTIYNILEALFEVILDIFGELVIGFLNIFGLDDMIDNYTANMMDFKNGMREGLASMQEYAIESRELADVNSRVDGTLFEVSKGFGEVGDAAENSATKTKLWNDQISDSTDLMKKLNDGSITARDSIKDIPAVAQEAMIHAGAGFRMTDKDGNEVFKAFDKVGTKAGDGMLGGLGDTLKEGMPDVSNPEDMVNNIVPEGTDVAMNAEGVEDMEAYTEGAETGLEDPEGYGTSEQQNMDAVIETVEDNKKPHKDAIKKNIVDPGVAVITASRETYRAAGRYAMAGSIEGVEDMRSEFVQTMVRTATGGYDAFIGPRGFDENSPSKRMFDAGVYAVLGFVNAIRKNGDMTADSMATMGGNGVEGFANALTNNGYLVSDAAAGLSDGIINSFGNPMGYVARMANGELAYDPTIRPVLDTSTIARGAYGINSMFNNQNVTLAGLSGQLAADIGQLDSRNSDVVAELQALREEMSYLSDDIQQMQVVMDTGALVGTMAGPMDKAMGRRAIYKGRGN